MRAVRSLYTAPGGVTSCRIRLARFVRCYATATQDKAPIQISAGDKARLRVQRNIGIAAHIDSGKTTLTERILYYTGRIASVHEVRGRDAVGAKMDSMDLEREKGITIQSAATFCDWSAPVSATTVEDPVTKKKEVENYSINIIDTPGHVDFTIEVERALRVLDGAVLVLCAVSGVQSQTITVDRQMKRYSVPRLAFINKMDRQGCNPFRVVSQLRAKLRMNAAALQVPIGVEDRLRGVVDLIRWKAIYNEGEKGINVIETDDIPADVLELAKEKRTELIEQLADADDALSDLFLEEKPISSEDLAAAIRRSTIACKFVPVLMGSAFKNTGVQPLLDAVAHYLPTPEEVPATAINVTDNENVDLIPAAEAPLVSLAFKLEEGKFGQLTYMRVYQGTLKRGMMIVNARTQKKIKVPRIVRMHSNEMEDVDSISAGEICAMFGVECSSGDTFNDDRCHYSMNSMFVPEPVISLALQPQGKETPAFSKALNRFQKEDPTFRVKVDQDSGETIISGMGELHLEIYVERMKREYGVVCTTGRPKVAFRETITEKVNFNYTHKKQSGGAGQYAKMEGYIEPIEVTAEEGLKFEFENRVIGGNIPTNFIPAVEKGFRDALERGALVGHQIGGVRVVLEDGAYHSVDSSDLAFRLCASGCFREIYPSAKPIVLEPVMKVEVVAPTEYQGVVVGGINQRKGTIADTDVREDEFCVSAMVSLNEMFGYSSQLRGTTQGKGEYSMEYKEHAPVQPYVQKEMAEVYRKSIGRASVIQ